MVLPGSTHLFRASDDLSAARCAEKVRGEGEPVGASVFIAAAAADWVRRWPGSGADLWEVPTGWRIGDPEPITAEAAIQGYTVEVILIPYGRASAVAWIEGGTSHQLDVRCVDDTVTVWIDGACDGYQVVFQNDDGELDA